MIRSTARLCLLCLGLLVAWAASAQEVITAFQQAIILDKDASMQVTETIGVNAEGRDIRHGIFRDFPLTSRDATGSTATVDLTVQSVSRDGSPEQWRSENIDGGVRIYIGSADANVSPGRHEYQLTYSTKRQIRYFEDYDELYWNVTGTGWLFPILEASATIMLPEGVRPQGLDFATGPLGSKGRNARVNEDGSDVVFETTRPLAPKEGLTIAIKLAKGAVDAPSVDQQRAWFLRDNSDLIIAGIGLLLVLAYYGRNWVKVGRDPERGVVVPRWDAPEGTSPALVNYIDNRGFSSGGWTALSSAALNLAVNGYVVLEDLDSSIVIRRTAKTAAGKLDAGEQTLLNAIGGKDDALVIDKAHGEKVQATGEAFRDAIEKEHRNAYYKSNALYTFGGILLSLVVFVCIVVFGRLHQNAMPLIIVPGMLSVFGVAVAAFIGRSFRPSAGTVRKVFAVLAVAFIAFVAVSVVAILFAAQTSSPAIVGDLPLTVAIIGIFAANCVFFFLMGAPTALGARVMDGIAGLRQYLTLAEKDRMNMQGAPTMSPKHFETLLPYAVALGVEKPWTKSFESWFAAAAVGGVAYAPGWYGGSFGADSFSDRIGGFSSSMASTIASTIPAPVSTSDSAFSSSSGGSSSGGGGGGGGGGGW
ncbi:DUF2207 domain-containing protein [Rhizobium tumorigenes]|uniref:DUF2207 domain-containing protein n=1 Tax=Rhizobium tumorigenes TaxID=2041385 RepID=A0AAF1K553_9HYPH|nr:DUF2207 domain-containing protein [Rhizobium tumorigenes]WFR95969.1 DUF2207 domain-containing protein [Rhizobium tumorigenes]